MRRSGPGCGSSPSPAGRYADARVRRLHRTVRAGSEAEGRDAGSRFVGEVRDAALPEHRGDRDVTVDEAIAQFLVEHLLGEKGAEARTVEDYRRSTSSVRGRSGGSARTWRTRPSATGSACLSVHPGAAAHGHVRGHRRPGPRPPPTRRRCGTGRLRELDAGAGAPDPGQGRGARPVAWPPATPTPCAARHPVGPRRPRRRPRPAAGDTHRRPLRHAPHTATLPNPRKPGTPDDSRAPSLPRLLGTAQRRLQTDHIRGSAYVRALRAFTSRSFS